METMTIKTVEFDQPAPGSSAQCSTGQAWARVLPQQDRQQQRQAKGRVSSCVHVRCLLDRAGAR